VRPWEPSPPLSGASYSAVELSGDATRVFMLDQRLLPAEERYLVLDDAALVADAIRDMVVRGAPAIGIAAAYGMALAAGAARALSPADFRGAMEVAGARLVATRPTAVNLAWAVGRCLEVVGTSADHAGDERALAIARLARQIHSDDVAACKTMGRIGAELLAGVGAVLTHCNAGALATGGYGTALGVIRAAAARDRSLRIYAGETRPYLQGARLTAWELARDGLDVTVVTDGMTAHCMQGGRIQAVVVGADRIARSGDVANKIGTYAIACLARQHRIPFYVAAPWSTVDLATPSGSAICIEERAPIELTHFGDRRIIPEGVNVYNPAFDVTPAELITAIITERGAFAPHDVAQGAKAAAGGGARHDA
jgi:methylthioribose-1-phosphate isomerase